MNELEEWVLAQLPNPPARVLEVGCGSGDLARAIAAEGYDVIGIDPAAPDGAIFRRVALEEFGEAGSFDAVVASRSLHHVGDLEAALDKIAGLSPLLVLDEFGWDLLDEPARDWWLGQYRILRAVGQAPEAPGTWREWRKEHEDLHGYAAMRAALDQRYSERFFAWTPYLYRYLGGEASEMLERTLIDAGAINALGFRYVGISR
jgi:SAM-dependent methyltransferase